MATDQQTSPNTAERARLVADLTAALGADKVLARPIDVIAYASDASFYHLVPKVVVQPASIAEMQAVMTISRNHRVPLTLRAAGTSLSGQAITDGILVDVARHWTQLTIEREGHRVRVGPGVIGGRVNRALSPYGRRIGPDPASIDSCMIGGIIANNASGMCCGVSENSYHTVTALRAVLPSSVILDSAHPEAEARLAAADPALVTALSELRDRVRADEDLCRRIRRKYRSKNTTGYALNAFLDFDTPAAILTRLLIGSEGTLGFIAEAVFATVPDYRYKRTGLLFFDSVHAAAKAAYGLTAQLDANDDVATNATGDASENDCVFHEKRKTCSAKAMRGPRAIEIMDRACLHASQGMPGMPGAAADLPQEAAALLIEYQCATHEELAAMRAESDAALAALTLALPAHFTEDEAERAALWRIRKGLLPAIGAVKAGGDTVVIEDIAVPRKRMADAILDLQRLLRDHGYTKALLFGHAKDGNCHFVFTQNFSHPADIDRYRRFIEELVTLVTKRYDGALKAEHGTGRNMAPFVEAEWGSTATAIMHQLKAVIDPDGLFNPGVIISHDRDAHVRHLKTLPTIEPEADACIECGLCEAVCPSRTLTLTPRRRIVIRRELARLRDTDGNHPEPGLNRDTPDPSQSNLDPNPTALNIYASLEHDYRYDGIDTCATDGLCADACPIGIDTGGLIKHLRQQQHSALAQRGAERLLVHGAITESTLRAVISMTHRVTKVIGDTPINLFARACEALSGRRLPRWTAAMPQVPVRTLPASSEHHCRRAEMVYLPSCMTRMMGIPPGTDRSLIEVVTGLAERAGAAIWIPPDSRGQCCGLPFASKGFDRAYRVAYHRLLARMWDWSRGGQRPLVVDASSCTYSLRTAPVWLDRKARKRLAQLVLIDATELAYAWTIKPDSRLPGRLAPVPSPGRILLHPSCATRRLGLSDKLHAVALRCASEVEMATHPECCATAGDRGFMYPELPRAALALEQFPHDLETYSGYYSTNLTCEVGLSEARGVPYQSFWYLLDAAS